MIPQVRKQETADSLVLTLRMYVEQVQLHLDKQVCIRCDICSLVCPRQAVAVIPGETDLDIDIDPRRCVLCEVCAHFCPLGAITLTLNGQTKAILTEHQGLAPFLPKIRMDKGKCPEACAPLPEGEIHWCRQQLKLIANALEECPKHCHRCLEACPRQAIVLDEAGLGTLPQVDLCLRCSRCLEVCRYDSIEVNPQFVGEVIIDDRKCPPDCRKCIDLCPVQAIVREGDRVFLRVERCSYCGVCRNICDEDAVTLIRREVVALPGTFSQAWAAALTKLLGDEQPHVAGPGRPPDETL
ncbi:MAG: 4Fe-4S dicluster domain-containing protein [Deltaproteobacteria bacterium]|nr:4Fe-4S dicluster domain-containing protein [Deltaproteobacteria bacterium]